jgi:DNA-directed RNA polymerase specialized sigma24 family protein
MSVLMAETLAVESESRPLGLPDGAVRAIVRKVAKRKIGLFAYACDVGIEDLMQEGLLAVSRAKGFDPAKARASTWVYLVSSRAALDLARKRARDAKKDVGLARPEVTHSPERDTYESGSFARWIAPVSPWRIHETNRSPIRSTAAAARSRHACAAARASGLRQ